MLLLPVLRQVPASSPQTLAQTGLRVSKASIAKIMGVGRSTLYHFIHSRHCNRMTRYTVCQEGFSIFGSVTMGTHCGHLSCVELALLLVLLSFVQYLLVVKRQFVADCISKNLYYLPAA